MPVAMAIHTLLRAGTRANHEAVDAAFGRFDLAARASYADFLVAHARALLAAEGVLAMDPTLPAWRPRAPALLRDLAALGRTAPPPLAPPAFADRAERLGLLYVVEGSRLGGDLLARTVGGGLPAAYLGERHGPGEWRMLLAALDAEAEGREASWLAALLAGAAAGFDLYARAAAG